MVNVYEVLKSNNLVENGFHLSVTRGEIREDLSGFFTKPYLDWLSDEKFLLALKDGAVAKEVEKIIETKTEETVETKTEETVETKTEAFVDLGADNPDIEEIEETEETEEEDEDGFPDFDVMDIKDVKQYAIDHKVEISGLKKKSDIIDAIYDDLAE